MKPALVILGLAQTEIAVDAQHSPKGACLMIVVYVSAALTLDGGSATVTVAVVAFQHLVILDMVYLHMAGP